MRACYLVAKDKNIIGVVRHRAGKYALRPYSGVQSVQFEYGGSNPLYPISGKAIKILPENT